jgi:cell division protein FtsZ
VDESATRIREEVDPEANIILGATFDESLEGTMRVSVVATGLAPEHQVKTGDSEETAQAAPPEKAPKQSLYGFTGKQPVPVNRPVEPRVVGRAQIRTQLQSIRAGEDDPFMADATGDAPDSTPAIEHAARAARRAPRMPTAEDFPPHARKQIQAQQFRVSKIAEQGQHRKKGLLERLTGGLSRRDIQPQESPQMKEPTMSLKSGQRAKANGAEENKLQNVHHLNTQIDPAIDDDQLEIPAFLRRQAN